MTAVENPDDAHIPLTDGSAVDVLLDGERLDFRDAYDEAIELTHRPFNDGVLVVTVGWSHGLTVEAAHLDDDGEEKALIPCEFEAREGDTKLFLADDERYAFEIELVRVRPDEPEIRTDGGTPTDETEPEITAEWLEGRYFCYPIECGICGEALAGPEENGALGRGDALAIDADGRAICSTHTDAIHFVAAGVYAHGGGTPCETNRSFRPEDVVAVRSADSEADRLVTDGGFTTRTLRVGPARTVAYGPAGASSGEWALRFTTEDGERVSVRLDEPAMYELWTEVHNVPWPNREDDRHDLQREIVARAERAGPETLREALDVLGGETA